MFWEKYQHTKINHISINKQYAETKNHNIINNLPKENGGALSLSDLVSTVCMPRSGIAKENKLLK